MLNNNDRWSALSLKDRADLMNMYITNGISDIKEMKKHYNSFSGEENHPIEVQQGLQNGTIKAVKKEDGTYAYIKVEPRNIGPIEEAITPAYKSSEEENKKLAELYMRISGGWDGKFLSLGRKGIPALHTLYNRKQQADTTKIDNVLENAKLISKNRDYTGVITLNDRDFKTTAAGTNFITKDLGYSPDFVTPLFHDVVPEGVIVKENNSKGGNDHRGESHLFRSKQQKHIDKHGEPYRIFQLNKEILDSNVVNYLDSLVNIGDDKLKLEQINTSLPFAKSTRVDDGGYSYDVPYAYDGQNVTKVTAKDNQGIERVKYIDIFDANPENEGININFLTQPMLNMFEQYSKPYIVTTPWM